MWADKGIASFPPTGDHPDVVNFNAGGDLLEYRAVMRIVVVSAFVVLIVGFPLRLSAQGWYGGIRTGVNFANVEFASTSPDIQTEDVNGLVISGAVQYGFTNWLGLRAEVGYSEKGFKVTEEGGTSVVSLQYLSLPLVADVRIPTGTFSPHFFTGPVAALEIGCSVGAGNAALVLFGADCTSAEADTKGYDFGWLFGGGLIIQSGAPQLVLDLGYNLGLTDITGNPNSQVKNGSFLLSIAMLFPLGGN